MERSLMIIGGGLLQLPAIDEAKELGLKTIVTDYNPHAPGLAMADVPVVISTRDVNGTVRAAKQLHDLHNIAGVMTVGTDASTTVAAVAAALHLPGIRYQDAEAASNKIKMRERFLQHGVPSPKFLPVWSFRDLTTAVVQIGFPCVIKPSDNMGARGVRRLNQNSELDQAFRWAKESSPSGALIVEEYMDGPELSIDAIIYGNEVTFTGVADRIIEYAPFFVETGHTIPSQLPEAIVAQALAVMRLGIQALGINIGAAKGDIKICADGVKVGELAARLSGGFMSAYTYPYSSGIKPIRAAIRVAIGEEPGLMAAEKNLVCIERAILDQPGTIESIEGYAEAMAAPGIKNIFLLKNAGDESLIPRSNVDKIGNIIALAENLKQAQQYANQAREMLKIGIKKKSEVTFAIIKKNAVANFNKFCHVCRVCDGVHCASGVPGMGGTGNMQTFRRNTQSLDRYCVLPNYFSSVLIADLRFSLFGQQFSSPVLAAPVTGTITNMGGALLESEYIATLLQGCADIGSLACLGDGASQDKYKLGMELARKTQAKAIAIFKPHADLDWLRQRIADAESAGLLAWGIDIDALHLATMKKGELLAVPSSDQLQSLRSHSSLPMVVKGILSPKDALVAMEAGCDAIIVSNHGGRAVDGLPASIDMLDDIVAIVKKRIPVLIDGGFRNGQHVFTALAKGADAVLIGRPIAICNVGAGAQGVSLFIAEVNQQLASLMKITGCASLADIHSDLIAIF